MGAAKIHQIIKTIDEAVVLAGVPTNHLHALIVAAIVILTHRTGA